MNSYEVKRIIAEGLNNEFTELIVEAEQVHKKPDYPFATFQVIVANQNEYVHDNIKRENVPITDPNFTYNVRKSKIEQPQMTMTINAYSLVTQEANELAQNIKDWLDFRGDLYLDSNNIVVVESEDIQQRDLLIVDNYERRYGFDVIIRYDNEVNVDIETIESFNSIEV